MKQFLNHRSRRFGYDGWALKLADAKQPLAWTVCTTRAEVRALKAELEAQGRDMFKNYVPVKVKIQLEVVC